jgi:2,4-dienoyl-CoA reductase-like NADH-dependent reductase (Old Yellow Enzyme family)
MNFEFKHLFTPLIVGPLTLRNRIYVTPHATMFASDDRNNLPGERLANYCAERIKGGAALSEVSMGIVSLTESSSGVLSATSDSHFAHMGFAEKVLVPDRRYLVNVEGMSLNLVAPLSCAKLEADGLI